jgi:hypothetical protein
VAPVGFNFVLQAELQLVSSRQQVHQDSEWNLWLRGQLPVAFAAAMEASEPLRENIGMYLPRADEVSDSFWRAAVPAIMDRCGCTVCRPVVHDDSCVHTYTDIYNGRTSIRGSGPYNLVVTRKVIIRIPPGLGRNPLIIIYGR